MDRKEVVIRPRRKQRVAENVDVTIHTLEDALYVEGAIDERRISQGVLEEMRRDARFQRVKENREKPFWLQVPVEYSEIPAAPEFLRDMWREIRLPYEISYREFKEDDQTIPVVNEQDDNIPKLSKLKSVKNVHLLGSGYFGDEATESRLREQSKRKTSKKKRASVEMALDTEEY